MTEFSFLGELFTPPPPPPPPDIYTFVTIQDGLSQQLKPTVNEKHNMLSLNFRHRLQKINKNQIKSNKYS